MGPSLRLYVSGVIAGGGWLLLTNIAGMTYDPRLALTLLAAALLVSVFKLRLPLGSGESTMSMAYAVDFLAIVTGGMALAMVVATAAVIVQCTMRVRRRQPWYRTAFSVAAVVLAIQAAGSVWTALGGTIAEPGVMRTAVPLALAGVVYFAVNAGLVALAIALSTRTAPAPTCIEFARTAPAVLAAAAVAGVTQLLVTQNAYVLVPFAAVPLLLCYVGYAAAFDRVAARQTAPPVTT